ncbi:DUF2232 domain-containing protein [Bradyrhizobium sp. CSA112]|uniref:hypothetical protein n=1 Tax=Bradyrhizobium sp. CSA112 TaxID=2699170 RepID=UPI0023B1506F|nr:hypothetical protein [Bradyrhizobium sp. CSA112]MDE5452116.1 DUF2232 domain-containing protein [Bradyrhizobium sp. CSA112]
MIAIIPIGLAAGCASALMFASIISGALFSLLLFYLAPLPLMVAALGWGPLAATIGGIAAASGLGAIFGLPYCIAFAITVAVPAWWLGHLALLGRPLPATAPEDGSAPAAVQLEWYPIGRVLLWIAGFAALTTIAAMLTLGGDADTITGVLRRGLTRILAREAAPSADVERLVAALAIIAPAAATIVAMMTLTLNLWLAGKITATSGRLQRPWPDLKSAELPPMTLVALSVALAFCFVGGLVAMFAQIMTTALLMAYALTGFAVLHTLTLAFKSRVFWLCCTYAIVVAFGWPALAMIALGLADAVFGIRQRYLRSRPPPLPAS